MDKKNDIGGALSTTLAKGTRWNGTMKAETGIRIDGEFEGNLETSGLLVVGKDGVIKAEIKVRDAIIGGKVTGNVTAANKVELQSGSSLSGDVKCRGIIIDNDVFFEGHSKMNPAHEPGK
ncbi:MAG TPA: polymer-forming cytoskeletal protein [Candidatus Edwardsbacteria bacterium]|nr:polymer-forming cytoskeletal protein [Candidatus Edwardsbacteria bacterium]